MSGHSFQFTPGGIAPMAVSQSSDADETIIPANPDLFRSPDVSEPAPRLLKRQSKQLAKPLNVLREAKKRLKDVNRELKRLAKLEKERDELKRLIHAAENKPCAIVRDIAAKRG